MNPVCKADEIRLSSPATKAVQSWPKASQLDWLSIARFRPNLGFVLTTSPQIFFKSFVSIQMFNTTALRGTILRSFFLLFRSSFLGFVGGRRQPTIASQTRLSGNRVAALIILDHPTRVFDQTMATQTL